MKPRNDSPRELLFRWSVSLKGIHAALEVLGGIALFFITPDFIVRAVAFLTQDEIAEDPNDLVAGYLLAAARNVSVGGELFAALYLVSHGVVKGLLVIALLRRRLWAYPASIVVFGLFIAYQIYRYTFTLAPGLIALSLFDFVVIWLIWIEYRALQRGGRAG